MKPPEVGASIPAVLARLLRVRLDLHRSFAVAWTRHARRPLPALASAVRPDLLARRVHAWAARLRLRCLPRSLTLASLLRDRGIPAEVVIGVALRDGRLSAHAWVEVDGAALNERPAEDFQRIAWTSAPDAGDFDGWN